MFRGKLWPSLGDSFNSQGNSDHFLAAVCLEICREMFFDAKPKFEGEKKLGSVSDACWEGEAGNGGPGGVHLLTLAKAHARCSQGSSSLPRNW